MKRRFIVLIDFSPTSAVLMSTVKTWNRYIHAEILLVHQISYAIPVMADSSHRAQIIRAETDKANHDMEIWIRKHFPNHAAIQSKIFIEGLIHSLRKTAGKQYQDIIILGTKGQGILKKYFMGSTALNVIDQLNQFIISIPDNYQGNTPKKLTVSVTYEYPLNTDAFLSVLGMMHGFIQSVEFISAVTPKDSATKSMDYLKQLTFQVQSKVPSSFSLFEGKSAFSEIKKHVIKTTGNILVVQKGSRSLSDQLFRKFFINEIVHDNSLPLMIIPS